MSIRKSLRKKKKVFAHKPTNVPNIFGNPKQRGLPTAKGMMFMHGLISDITFGKKGGFR